MFSFLPGALLDAVSGEPEEWRPELSFGLFGPGTALFAAPHCLGGLPL